MPKDKTPQNTTVETLSPAKTKALEALLQGQTMTAAAEAAGVDRSTLYRWKGEDFHFQAALNRGRQELVEATAGRLLRSANRAAENVATAIDNGDLSASLTLLKGLAVLSGNPLPPIGSADPDVLEAEAEAAAAEKSGLITDLRISALLS